LGANAGFWSLCAIEAGADHVLGVDARAMHVEQAELVFAAKGIAPARYAFRQGDVHAIDLEAQAPFDVVLCLGLLYHVNDPVGLFRRLDAWTREALIVDTAVAPGDGAGFDLLRETSGDPRRVVGSDLVLRPTRGAVVELGRAAGFSVEVLEPRFSSWTGSADFRDGRRLAFLCRR
ncbi:MAG TPA: class I SAM-dependent methyltransferase, partial [Solirubrobacteraceae bacterium]|nr:class I SAM-dependent methyltransferase [Solirubrobacteraceae bacterium]